MRRCADPASSGRENDSTTVVNALPPCVNDNTSPISTCGIGTVSTSNVNPTLPPNSNSAACSACATDDTMDVDTSSGFSPYGPPRRSGDSASSIHFSARHGSSIPVPSACTTTPFTASFNAIFRSMDSSSPVASICGSFHGDGICRVSKMPDADTENVYPHASAKSAHDCTGDPFDDPPRMSDGVTNDDGTVIDMADDATPASVRIARIAADTVVPAAIAEAGFPQLLSGWRRGRFPELDPLRDQVDFLLRMLHLGKAAVRETGAFDTEALVASWDLQTRDHVDSRGRW